VLLDVPGRVRSQIVSVMCQILEYEVMRERMVS
jgi:hypothetical protein